MCKTFHATAATLCNKYQTLPIAFYPFSDSLISTAIMSVELFLTIFFGTLSCVIGLLQLWMAFHQYVFWVWQLQNRRVITLWSYDNSLLEAAMDQQEVAMDQQFSASIESFDSFDSFTTCDSSFN